MRHVTPPRTIRLKVEAPAMPAAGAQCNGCGVCCAWAPCPLGILVSGRRSGRCRALRWDTSLRLYRCGLVQAPGRYWRCLPAFTHPWVARWSRRWISASSGCDASLEIAAAPD